MARRTTPGPVTRHRKTALAVFLLCIAMPAQTVLTLREAGARKETTDFAPARVGQNVVLRGIVNAPAFRFAVPEYTLLSIEQDGYGAMLQGQGRDARLLAYRPGDEIEAEGVIAAFHGMPVLLPSRIQLLGRRGPPPLVDVPAAQLQSHQYLGRLVRTAMRVERVSDAPNGTWIDAGGSYGIFVPSSRTAARSLGLARGDTIQALGIAYQYCPQAPFNRGYQLLVYDASGIVKTGAAGPVSPVAMAGAFAVLVLLTWMWWSRERRLRLQRERLRKTYQLGEEVLGSSSAESILKRLREALPEILGISRVHLYVLNRASRTLESVAAEDRDAAPIPLSAQPDGTQSGAGACFHYRTLLVIPDIDRSPFRVAGGGDASAKSVLFVPIVAQGSVIGVLELDQDDRLRDFTADEQELAQHVGNHAGVALRLIDQRFVQEQLYRTEKLAAVGRLISGVVNELKTPLASISDLAVQALEKSYGSVSEREVSAIAAEARKATGMVARLASFASAESEARPVSIGSLLKNLIEFREGDWKASGIRVQDLISSEPALVLGLQGQLEQVFLNLFVHVEQILAEAANKVISIRNSVLGRRVLVEISFTASPGWRKPEETAAVLGVTRSIIAGHGGEVRLIERNHANPVFEVEMPATVKERAGLPVASNGHAPEAGRHLTLLVIDADETSQRQMLGLLANRGHRVVPVNNADTGFDLAQRMRFDAAFVSVHAPGLNWVELSERLQPRIGGFVLVSDSYDAELSADFEGEARFVLPKPVQEADLDRILGRIELQAPAGAVPGRNRF